MCIRDRPSGVHFGSPDDTIPPGAMLSPTIPGWAAPCSGGPLGSLASRMTVVLCGPRRRRWT
eukprot:2952090-Alexandrium_andersonii.AAC.1